VLQNVAAGHLMLLMHECHWRKQNLYFFSASMATYFWLRK